MVAPQKMGCCVKNSLLVIAGLVLLGGNAVAKSYYVTVAGLGGEDDYQQRFASWAEELDKTLRDAGGDAEVETLSGDEATLDRVREVLIDISKRATEQDALAFMMIGHGTHDGYEYKFNLPGRDLSASELRALLDGIKAHRQLVANMTSSSGASVEALQAENRIVITATRNGTERNAVVFARYWVAALRDATTDTDKNDAISALEAFVYASRKTAEFYESQERLATEHPLVEDTGIGEGAREPSRENGEGLLAAQFNLLRIGQTQLAAQDPVKRPLIERKEELEAEIDTLKYDKAAIPLTEYKQRLTRLLIELAQTQAKIDEE